jgi:hypothetical protein
MEDVMRKPHVDDFVRLTQDIPELSLQRGEVGVVRSTWFAPSLAYEVEFHPPGLHHETRALLLAEQVQVEEGSLFGKADALAADPSDDISGDIARSF